MINPDKLYRLKESVLESISLATSRDFYEGSFQYDWDNGNLTGLSHVKTDRIVLVDDDQVESAIFTHKYTRVGILSVSPFSLEEVEV